MSRLIDADSLLQVIRKNIPKNPHDEYQEGQEIGLSMAVEMVCNEPTVDTERHGQWVKENEEDTFVCVYKCSLCGGEVLSEAYLFKYCPYCGCAIKMEVEK